MIDFWSLSAEAGRTVHWQPSADWPPWSGGVPVGGFISIGLCPACELCILYICTPLDRSSDWLKVGREVAGFCQEA